LVLGLQKDLGLTGTQQNTALTIFFVPYVLFEMPPNILLEKLKPHVWLSLCMFGSAWTASAKVSLPIGLGY